VFSIAGRLVPRHVLFSTNWVTKHPDISDEATACEEARFIARFPHSEVIENAFHLAGIDYGRIDYGMHEGRIQVWEINTNPIIIPPRERIAAERLPSQTRSANLIREALEAVVSDSPRTNGAFPLRTTDLALGKAAQWLGRRYANRRW
jgi:hypothetical protein